MAKRRAYRSPASVSAVEVPALRDWLVDRARGMVARPSGWAYDVDPEGFVGSWRALAKGWSAGDLWWVAQPMARLAHEAAGSLPEWTPHAARPSLFGVLAWDGGIGMDDGDGAPVVALAWDFSASGDFAITPVSRERHGGDWRVGEVAQWEADGERFAGDERMWGMLGATWLLAQSPSVGVARGRRFDRMDPLRPFARPLMPGKLTEITLREQPPMALEPGDDDGSSTGRSLSQRFIVRGHWRQQACGPGRLWRKPTYVSSYVKGPEGAPLVTKPAVHVWRR